MILTAVVGLALAAVGYNAPRMPSSLAAAVGSASPAATSDPRAAQPATSASTSAQAATPAATASAQAAPPATASATSKSQATASAGSGSQATASAKPAGQATASASGSGTSASSSSSSGSGAAATASAAAAPGPLLSQTQYAPYAYQIYPGTPSASAQQALSGFQVSFKSAGGGKEQITITAYGQSQNATFIATDKLYFVETRLSDDGFGQDTNSGDDGFVLTDAGGHLVNH